MRNRLAGMTQADMRKLAGASGVPFHTILKIRRGETSNPRIETVASLWPLLVGEAATKPAKRQPAAARG